MFTNSTSKHNVENAGMIPLPTAFGPYPNDEGTINFAEVPFVNNINASSQPLITTPCPTGNSNGLPESLEESNLFPFNNVPV